MTILKFVSKELSNGVRLHEPLLLLNLLSTTKILKKDFEEELKKQKVVVEEEDLLGMLNIVNGDFYKKAENKGDEKKRQYSNFDLVDFFYNDYSLSKEFSNFLD